jgi:hypothetical protein
MEPDTFRTQSCSFGHFTVICSLDVSGELKFKLSVVFIGSKKICFIIFNTFLSAI